MVICECKFCQQYRFYVRVEISTKRSTFWVAGALLNRSFALTSARYLLDVLLEFPANDLSISVVAGERSDQWGSCGDSRQESSV